MAINKVIYGGNTLLDVTGTTATAADVASGKQFVNAAGVLTTGTASGGGGGGASNFVTGTFKGTTTGAAMEIDLPYTGNGYPVAIMIYPSEGPYNSNSGSFYNLVQRYAAAYYTAIKGRATTAPLYMAGESDGASTTLRYKSHASDATSYGTTVIKAASVYNSANAEGTSSGLVRIKNATTMSVFIASTSYGFAANIEYTYHVIYSE